TARDRSRSPRANRRSAPTTTRRSERNGGAVLPRAELTLSPPAASAPCEQRERDRRAPARPPRRAGIVGLALFAAAVRAAAEIRADAGQLDRARRAGVI